MSLLLGAHLSIAGGFDKAVRRARQIGCDCLQLFTQNCTQWANRKISTAEGEAFRKALRECAISHPIAHAGYLINLASPNPGLWKKSIRGLTGEIRRAAILGIQYLVIHPGSYTNGTPTNGIARICKALDEVRSRTANLKVACLLETTAGQGTALGQRFEELADILAGVEDRSWLGICVDTCHLFAAGYPLFPEEAYEKTIGRLDLLIGCNLVKAVHLNDSRGDLGSRIDRHAHIGWGKIGLGAFALFLADKRLNPNPMYIETPKEVVDGQDMDVVNLRILRECASRAG